MNITILTVLSSVKRHLAALGKRLSKDGKSVFSEITVSSAEEPLLTQYIKTSAQDIEATLKMFISSATYSTTSISMTIENSRGDADFATRVQDMAESYITLNCVGEYLSMTQPELARKYQDDAQQRIDSLLAYVAHKNATEAPLFDYKNVTATIS